MIDDSKKINIIFLIDKYLPALKGSCYSIELKQMRLKYVYKDISQNDYDKDLQYIKDIKDMLNHFYYKKHLNNLANY